MRGFTTATLFWLSIVFWVAVSALSIVGICTAQPWGPAVTANVQTILARGAELGREPGKLMMVGDSHTEAWPWISKPVCEGTAPADVAQWLGTENWATDGWGPPGCTPESSEFTDGTWCYGKGRCCGNSSGDTISRHLERGYPESCVELMNASWATVMLGTNSLPHVAAEGSYQSWGDRLLGYVQGYVALGVVPVLLTIPPRLDVPEGSVELMNEQVLRVATELDIPLVDLYAELPAGLIGDDGVHITREGYEVVNRLIFEAAAELMELAGNELPDNPVVDHYVATVDQLRAALRDAQDGQTIRLEAGVYWADPTLYVTGKNDLTIAGPDSGTALLTGDFWEGGDDDTLLEIGACSNVLIDNLVFAYARAYLLKIDGEASPSNIRVRGCGFYNWGTRAIKGTAGVVDGGSITSCHFQNFLPIPPTWPDGGNYIGGIDMMGLRNFTIAGNTFKDIKGASGSGRGAIFVWQGCENVTITDNEISGCDRGICLGNPSGTPPHVAGAFVSRNFVDCGTWYGLEVALSTGVQLKDNIIQCLAEEASVALHDCEVEFEENDIEGALKLFGTVCLSGDLNLEVGQ